MALETRNSKLGKGSTTLFTDDKPDLAASQPPIQLNQTRLFCQDLRSRTSNITGKDATPLRGSLFHLTVC